ncbi:MAG: hypothetical protein CM15mP120_20480 [Pseudomonadota bacterium]|nr:MAG: hypothetical protein CM15mP120_20480 [Pseudomonadota bacterium]
MGGLYTFHQSEHRSQSEAVETPKSTCAVRALVAFKQASWVINKQHVNVLFGSTHGQQLWYDVPLHSTEIGLGWNAGIRALSQCCHLLVRYGYANRCSREMGTSVRRNPCPLDVSK